MKQYLAMGVNGWNTKNWLIFHLKTQNDENLMRASIENNENTEKLISGYIMKMRMNEKCKKKKKNLIKHHFHYAK